MSRVWYVAVGGKQYGPYEMDEIAVRVKSGQANAETLVYGPNMKEWTALGSVPALAECLTAATAPQEIPTEIPASKPSAGMAPTSSAGIAAAYSPSSPSSTSAPGVADEIDYKIHGEEMQFVEIELDPGESAVAEAGAMMYMSQGIEMNAIFGDGGGQDGGFMGKLLGAGKRLLTGESLFMTVFTAQGSLPAWTHRTTRTSTGPCTASAPTISCGGTRASS